MEEMTKLGCELGEQVVPHKTELCKEKGKCKVCLDGEWLRVLDPYYYMKPCGSQKR